MENQDISSTLHSWSEFFQRFIQKNLSTLASAKMQIVVAVLTLSFYLSVKTHSVEVIVEGQVVTYMAPYLSGALVVALWSTLITAFLASRVAVPTISAIGDVINSIRGKVAPGTDKGENDGHDESVPPNPYG